MSAKTERSRGGEEGLYVLGWVLKDNFVVEFGNDSFAAFKRAWLSGGARPALEQFEDMVNGDRPFQRVRQVNLYLNLKLAPSCFCHLIWRFCDCPVIVTVAVMKLEVNLFDIC